LNLDPALGRVDRFASLIGGVAILAFAFLGGVDKAPVQALMVGVGLAAVIGGIGGT